MILWREVGSGNISFMERMFPQGNMSSTVPLFREKDSFSMIFLSYAPVGEQEFPPAGINARRKSNTLFSFLKRCWINAELNTMGSGDSRVLRQLNQTLDGFPERTSFSWNAITGRRWGFNASVDSVMVLRTFLGLEGLLVRDCCWPVHGSRTESS